MEAVEREVATTQNDKQRLLHDIDELSSALEEQTSALKQSGLFIS